MGSLLETTRPASYSAYLETRLSKENSFATGEARHLCAPVETTTLRPGRTMRTEEIFICASLDDGISFIQKSDGVDASETTEAQREWFLETYQFTALGPSSSRDDAQVRPAWGPQGCEQAMKDSHPRQIPVGGRPHPWKLSSRSISF
jgi:hypothetical protein